MILGTLSMGNGNGQVLNQVGLFLIGWYILGLYKELPFIIWAGYISFSLTLISVMLNWTPVAAREQMEFCVIVQGLSVWIYLYLVWWVKKFFPLVYSVTQRVTLDCFIWVILIVDGTWTFSILPIEVYEVLWQNRCF